jgi:hypothetical protein
VVKADPPQEEAAPLFPMQRHQICQAQVATMGQVREGAIVLGTGGDNSFMGVGDFFEGAMITGYASDATDDAVQANIVAAGYGS